jgi:hypothetical protein
MVAGKKPVAEQGSAFRIPAVGGRLGFSEWGMGEWGMGNDLSLSAAACRLARSAVHIAPDGAVAANKPFRAEKVKVEKVKVAGNVLTCMIGTERGCGSFQRVPGEIES